MTVSVKRRTNHNTQEDFNTQSPRRWWNWFSSYYKFSIFIVLVIYICLSFCRFVKGNIIIPKMRTLFCLESKNIF